MLSSLATLLAASSLISTLTAVTAASVQYKQDGPWGTNGINNIWYDDVKYLQPANSVKMTVTCRSHSRLDYINIVYRDVHNNILNSVEHGNPEAGDSESSCDFGRTSEITGMTAYTCGMGKHNGEICGVKFTTDAGEYACGFIESDDFIVAISGRPIDFKKEGTQFRHLIGSTSRDKLVIKQIGWISEPRK